MTQLSKSAQTLKTFDTYKKAVNYIENGNLDAFENELIKQIRNDDDVGGEYGLYPIIDSVQRNTSTSCIKKQYNDVSEIAANVIKRGLSPKKLGKITPHSLKKLTDYLYERNLDNKLEGIFAGLPHKSQVMVDYLSDIAEAYNSGRLNRTLNMLNKHYDIQTNDLMNFFVNKGRTDTLDFVLNNVSNKALGGQFIGTLVRGGYKAVFKQIITDRSNHRFEWEDKAIEDYVASGKADYLCILAQNGYNNAIKTALQYAISNKTPHIITPLVNHVDTIPSNLASDIKQFLKKRNRLTKKLKSRLAVISV